jgi:hypothetical protein
LAGDIRIKNVAFNDQEIPATIFVAQFPNIYDSILRSQQDQVTTIAKSISVPLRNHKMCTLVHITDFILHIKQKMCASSLRFYEDVNLKNSLFLQTFSSRISNINLSKNYCWIHVT